MSRPRPFAKDERVHHFFFGDGTVYEPDLHGFVCVMFDLDPTWGRERDYAFPADIAFRELTRQTHLDVN
jgi:heat shock protein HspQ